MVGMQMQANFPVGHKVWGVVGTDSLGNDIEDWAEPVTLWVYGIAPVAQLGDQEPGTGRTAVTSLYQLLVPPGAVLGAQDRYVLDSGPDWEQEGEIADYTKGPFGFTPGYVVSIKRVTG